MGKTLIVRIITSLSTSKPSMMAGLRFNSFKQLLIQIIRQATVTITYLSVAIKWPIKLTINHLVETVTRIGVKMPKTLESTAILQSTRIRSKTSLTVY